MHFSFLIAAALGQGSGDLARLHPADVDLYLEVPNCQALVESVLSSPLLETLRDDAVAQFIDSISGEEPFNLDLLLGSQWEAQVPEVIRAPLEGLQTASLSLLSSPTGPEYLLIAGFSEESLATTALDLLGSEIGGEPMEDPAWPGAIKLQGMANPDSWLATRGNQLFLGSGGMRTAALLARLDGKDGPSVATNAMYTRIGETLTSTPVPTLLRGFSQRSPVTIIAELAMLDNGAPFEELGMLADMNFLGGAHRFRIGRQRNRFITEFFTLNTGDPDPLHGLVGGEATKASGAASIPTGVLGAVSTTMDAEKIGMHVREGLITLGQVMGADGLLGELEGELGFPLTQLFSHLGSQLTIQMQPIKGPSLPETAIWMDLESVEGFSADLAVIAEKLPQLFQGFEMRTRQYKVKNAEGERVPYAITSLQVPDGLIELPIPISISPSLTIADGRLLVGLNSTHVKRELKRLYGPTPADPEATDPWRSAGLELPEGAHCAAFIDWGAQISGVVSLAKALGPMVGEAFPVDWDAIPDGDTFVRQFKPTVHYSMPKNGGTYHYHEASFGPEVWVGGLMAAVLSTRSQDMSALSPGETKSTATSSEESLAQTMANLLLVDSAVTVFQVEHDGALPKSIIEMMAPETPAHAHADFLNGEYPMDAWMQPLNYTPGEDGAYTLYSNGPNGVDDGGAGDDISLD
ncbi:MAG: hypothetical protein ACI8QS_000054 [Planctomycetota bacterium]|jgi:hypothetical protein